MSTFATGQQAEAAAARFLERKGCTILCHNWRTRRCEIDIVAKRGGIVYICEVKYRSHGRQGRGLDYITPVKIRQLQFAAECWVAHYEWQGTWELCAIEVSGPSFQITGVVKDILPS